MNATEARERSIQGIILEIVKACDKGYTALKRDGKLDAQVKAHIKGLGYKIEVSEYEDVEVFGLVYHTTTISL